MIRANNSSDQGQKQQYKIVMNKLKKNITYRTKQRAEIESDRKTIS